MRPKKHETTGEADLFRPRLDQIIDMKHELVQLAGRLDWDWLDGEIAPLYSDKGRPGIETRFVIGLLLLKHISRYPTRRCVNVGCAAPRTRPFRTIQVYPKDLRALPGQPEPAVEVYGGFREGSPCSI
jgi:hypothetical protein